MRSIWNGVLHFGRVHVPVALVPATKSGRVDFRTLHRPCGNPVEQTTVCPIHGAVDADELVKGWELAPGQFVLVENEDLDAIVAGAGRDLATLAYVDASAIEPAYVRSTYYLRPASEIAGKRAYAIVYGALGITGAAMIVRYTARKVEHLAAVRAIDSNGVLGLQTLALAEDVANPAPIHESLAAVAISDQELELATQLVERHAAGFDPTLLVSEQRQRVRDLIEGRQNAGEIVVPQPDAVAAGDAAAPADLEAALRASLKDAPKPRRRRQPAARAAA